MTKRTTPNTTELEFSSTRTYNNDEIMRFAQLLIKWDNEQRAEEEEKEDLGN